LSINLFATSSVSVVWEVKTANYNLVAGDKIIGNHASTAFSLTLPLSPGVGDSIEVKNAGTALVTLNRNGSNIDSSASNATVPASYYVNLVYVSSAIGWLSIDKYYGSDAYIIPS
tara:strand:- start:4646 stop:4990 length:345 start_codon:yes stop_codon:yes gene_type:complete